MIAEGIPAPKIHGAGAPDRRKVGLARMQSESRRVNPRVGHKGGPAAPRRRLNAFSILEAAGEEKGPPYFGPSCLGQIAQDRTNTAPLRQGDVIEIQRACGWHTVCHCQDDFSH
jgi:hypothetical protein